MGRKVGEWVYADLENGKGEIIIYNNPPELSE
jgi:hypothetical protein